MNKNYLFPVLLIVGLFGAGLVYAHMGGQFDADVNNVDYSWMYDMHKGMDQILESGTYADLESLRAEYNMPIMHWVNSDEDLNLAKSMHESFGDSFMMGSGRGYGGCH